MKAVFCTRYGGPEVLKLTEVAKPAPEEDEVCIEIHASAVTASDIYIRSSDLPLLFKIPMRIWFGFRRPRKPIIGLVFAGVIETTGAQIHRFKPGDQVYGLSGFGVGAYAEFKCMKEMDSKSGCIALKPSNISFEEATMAAYGGLLAFQYLEKGNIQQGDSVLIYGASGTSGTLAVQIAKHLGAEVSGVCSTSNVEMVKSLGADHVLDYTRQDTLPSGVKYDLILDSVGKFKSSKLKNESKKALGPNGRYVSIDDGALKLDAGRLDKIREFIESGFIKPVLDRSYPLEDIVEAHRYVEKGHKKGGVAITVK